MRPFRILAAATIALALPVSPAAAAAGAAGYHPHTALVSFDPAVGAMARAAVHATLGARAVNRFERLGIEVVALPEGLDPAVAVRRYTSLPGVASASVNKQVRALGTPNDTLFENQWGFHNTGQPVAGSLVDGTPDFDIDGPEGWTAAFGATAFDNSGGTRVAILDTGIDRSHADLLGKVAACASATAAIGVVVEGSCSDDNLHGTHVAGTVAANTNNSVGVAGTAPNASLAIFKFLNAGGVGFLADEIAGIEWAHQEAGAKVISMSFGSYEPSSEEQSVLNAAYNDGVLLVAAAGNDGDGTKNYPAYYANVMSVAATNASDDIAWFSNCNTDVEIAAPGEDIWSTFPGNSYGVISGTSMATPHVSGVAALVMSEKGLSNVQTRNLMINTATPIAGNDGRSVCSSIEQANLAAALGGGSTEPPPTEPGAITGKVAEQKTRAAIAGASVSCGSAGSATTATDGTYTISNVTPGSYTCTASKSGYQSKSLNVSVSSGATTTANFTLRPSRTSSSASRGPR